jgi:hypothetical protein
MSVLFAVGADESSMIVLNAFVFVLLPPSVVWPASTLLFAASKLSPLQVIKPLLLCAANIRYCTCTTVPVESVVVTSMTDPVVYEVDAFESL